MENEKKNIVFSYMYNVYTIFFNQVEKTTDKVNKRLFL